MRPVLQFSFITLILVNLKTSAQFSVNQFDAFNAASMLMGPDVTITNVTYSGDPVQLGWVTNIPSFPTDNGLILSTSNIQNFIPNNFQGEPTSGLNTESDLLAIVNSVPPLIGQAFEVSSVNDVAILEFDFIAPSSNIDLNFVFGSDEYLTYVNTQYNDVFAIMISGPGIYGPYAAPFGFPNGASNLALVPESNPPLPITISSINNVVNSGYYIANPGNTINTNISLTGYTNQITVQQQLTLGEIYHLKLAIADGSDAALKSQIIIDTSYGNDAVNTSCAIIESESLSICEGANTLLSASDNSSFEINSENLIPIAGDGDCIQSQLYVYQEGAGLINSTDEIQNIHFSLEHSDLSNVAISISCPNGSSMNLFTGNDAFFSGINAGLPVEENNTILGIPYNYFFSPFIENPTWEEFLINNNLPAIPSGYYSPDQEFTNLIGCPINGIWTLNICPTNPIPYSNDCIGATSICNGIYSNLPPIFGYGTQDEFIGSCLWPYGNTYNTSWYHLEINTNGDLAFTILPEDTLADYDWALFNITDGGCESLMYEDSLTSEMIQTIDEVSCNSYGNFFNNGATGISNINGGNGSSNGPGDQNGPPFNSNIEVSSEEVYALAIINFNNSQSEFSIDFSESTTQFCGENPNNLANGNGNLFEFGISFHENNSTSNFTWSTGELNTSIVVSPQETTTYYLYSEANGLSCFDSVTVYVETPVEIVSDSTLMINNGNSILLSAIGADSYQWTNGSTTNQIEVSLPGYYEVVGFTENCVSADTVYISESYTICATIDEENFSICPGASAELHANLLSNDEISFDSGFYIPDNQGCLYTELIINQFNESTIANASDFSNIYFTIEHSYVGDITISIICPDGSVMSIFPEAGGSGTFLGEPIDDESGTPGVGYIYSFSPNSTGGTWMEYLSGGGASPVPAGDYEPEGSFDDLIGCPMNGIWQLEICDIVGADDGNLFDFGIQFLGGSPNDSLLWSTGETTTSITVSPQETTTYYLYSYANDEVCVDSLTVLVENPLEITSSDPPIICGENTVVLTASGADSYQWNTGSASNQITVVQAGVYTVTGYSENCLTSQSIEVTDNNQPLDIVAESTEFCSGDTITLVVSNELTDYFWNNGASGNIIEITSGGNYFVAGYDKYGCSYSSELIEITEFPFDNSITASDIAICDGQSVVLQVSDSNDILWSNNETTSIITVSEAGSYYAFVSNGPCSGYTETIIINEGITPIVAAFAVEDTLCSTDNPTLLFGTPNGGVWSGSGVAGNTFQPSLSGIGEFEITYTYTNSAGCTSSTNELITILDCSNLNEITLENFYSIYPNPFSNILIISNSQNELFNYSIFDMSGRIVQRSTVLKSSENISLDSLAPGIYSIRICDSNGSYAQSIVKL